MTDTSTQTGEPAGWREAERRRIIRTRRTLIVLLVVLVILLLITSYALVQIFQPIGKVASTKEGKGVTWVRSIYGWGKATDQQFWGPQGVGVGPDGTIWATTQAQNRVVGFNPDGTFNAMLYQGPQGDPKYPNALTYPVDVAVDSAGLIYVADQTRSQVRVLTRDNKLVRSIFVPTPASLAVSSDRLVVGSASGFVIMTPTGQVIKVLGKQGTGIDEFQAVRGVAIGKDGTIFAVDQFNNRVSAYDSKGNRKWIVSTGNPGNAKPVSSSIATTRSKAPANMQIPAGLTIDGANRLVIADPFGFDFVVLDSKDGRYITRYGAPGTLDGQFVYPSDVSYDPARDWFVVTDTQNARLQIIRLPDSGGAGLTGVNSALSGPLRACVIPLALIFLAIVAGIIYRMVKRRQRSKPASPAAQQADGRAEDVS
ncbi:MAG: NHL repeat-containing protein [Coriobacteriia bacterium]